MEGDTAIADCFALLLQNGFAEEHKFAADMLDLMLKYLNSKVIGYSIAENSALEHIDGLENQVILAEDGEIVEEAAVKVEIKVDPTETFMFEKETIDINIPRTKKINLKEKEQENKDNTEKENNVDTFGNNYSAKGEQKPNLKKDAPKLNKSQFTHYNCNYCTFSLLGEDDTFLGVEKFAASTMRKHKKKEHHVCVVCREKQDSPDQLKNHMTLVHTNSSGQMVCGVGDCKATPGNILCHIRVVHDKLLYVCGECGKPYQSWNRHVLFHNADPNDIINCSKCEYRTLSKHKFTMHNNKYHPSEGKRQMVGKMACDSCDFKTNGTSASAELEELKLIWHKGTHRDGEIACELCEFTTKKKFTFQRHLSEKHNIGEIYRCTICDYTTGGHSGKQHFQTHMKRHSGEKPFMCDKCDFKSIGLPILKRHMQRHEESPTFLCDGCDYKSYDWSNFRAHKKAKHGTVILSCEDCDFTTKSDRTLRNHQSKKHSTSLACGDCDFKTNSSFALRHHKTTNSHKS